MDNEQYLLLPIVLSGSFTGMFLGNTIYVLSAVAYWYITVSGYMGTLR